MFYLKISAISNQLRTSITWPHRDTAHEGTVSQGENGGIMEQWIWGYCAAWVAAIIVLIIELKTG